MREKKPTHSLFEDLTDREFGQLVVLRYSHSSRLPGGKNSYFWKCRCSCGRRKTVRGSALKAGVRSCGCLAKACATKHGYAANDRKKPEFQVYRVWSEMQQRCHNPNNNRYEYYGARGIKVCASWRGRNGFENFLRDMGPRPAGLWLERKENDKDYCPENCCWAPRKAQQRNSRNNLELTFDGRTQCAVAWAEELGWNATVIYNRKRLGWTDARTLTQPVRTNSRSPS